MPPRIVVVGAGVSGLASAVRILEALPGIEMTVVADEFPPNTTSDAAGGFWEPHLLGDTPEEKIREWSGKTFEYIVSLANSYRARHTGATQVSGYQLTASETFQEPFWKHMVYNYRRLSLAEVQKYPGMKNGFFYTTVMVEPRLYLPWLIARIEQLGGKLHKRKIESLEELVYEKYDVIVNCTGACARQLVLDNHVEPVRGQVVRVKAPWVKQFLVCEDGDQIGYVLPSSSFVVLGGVQNQGNWSREVNLTDKQAITDRCVKYMPSLKEAEFESDAVGLRPVRTQVRLETDTITSQGRTVPVVHNYGHGGSGFTLHWGCAEHVTRLVTRALGVNGPSKL